ncbi:MAG: hypothetical protein JXR63_12700 [Spirochaetales bacterium]|nr:hypothetical protein [Spirochaetales bacterium]
MYKVKNYLFVFMLSSCFFTVNAREWPLLKSYSGENLSKIALPIGGIGTGSVSINGYGEFQDWEIMNSPGKGFYGTQYDKPDNYIPFFCIYAKRDDGSKFSRGLMGPVDTKNYEHMEGYAPSHGIPRFRDVSFDTAYPFGIVNLDDLESPVSVRIKAFNPMIPGDADSSGIPIAVLTYEVTNKSNKNIEVAISGNIPNFVGQDGREFKVTSHGRVPTGALKNSNRFFQDDKIKGLYLYSDRIIKSHRAHGSIAISTDNSGSVTYRTSWLDFWWGNSLLDFWEDFADNGELENRKSGNDATPWASLAVKEELLPNETKTFRFYITWHFPNRKIWNNTDGSTIGNYYTTKYSDAKDVIIKTQPKIDMLEGKTIDFVETFVKSDIPEVLKEAALFNTSTLRTQTVFRIPSGHMMGWEGNMDQVGSCFGSCTHVWNYEQATPFLYGDLSMSMRDVEFNYSTRLNGQMSFRAALPLRKAKFGTGIPAADGQMGTILKMYRDWQLSGNDNFLRSSWPNIKKALAFAWEDSGWDSKKIGIMDGKQHNTMDVEYYGPNPQMGFWYLGALKAGGEMAKYLGDSDFAQECEVLYNSGSKWMEENLFNGEYFVHKIPDNKKDAYFQLGDGCLVDQLVGQYLAHVCGLGYLADKEMIATTLESILKYNYKDNFHDHFNVMRSYVLGDEKGLLMAAYPYSRPEFPFPYFTEVMTGFEYTVAAGLIYEGKRDQAIEVIKNIRDRFDGKKRNPFNEIECGNHYARAMASWGAYIAWTGFQYSAVSQIMHITDNPGSYFWSNGYSWGKISVSSNDIRIEVLHGEINLKEIISGGKEFMVEAVNIKAGESATAMAKAN